MNTDVHCFPEAVAAAALAVVLAWAVLRPRGLPEAVAAVPAAALVIGEGAVTPHADLTEVRRLAPVVGFLGCVLVLAKLCDDEGLFRACGAWLARGDAGRSGRRLLVRVFAVASATTAVLSLDATVVLLTPVVLAAAADTGMRARPHAYGRPPVEFGVAAAADLQPDESAGVRGERAVVRCRWANSPG